MALADYIGVAANPYVGNAVDQLTGNLADSVGGTAGDVIGGALTGGYDAFIGGGDPLKGAIGGGLSTLGEDIGGIGGQILDIAGQLVTNSAYNPTATRLSGANLNHINTRGTTNEPRVYGGGYGSVGGGSGGGSGCPPVVISSAGGPISGELVFPYYPQVTVTFRANYAQQKLIHSNWPAYAYENSEVSEISITGDVTVQNAAEGQYLISAIWFLRAATKMCFGSSPNAGSPPPLVRVNGYGSQYFPNVLCAVTQFSHNMSIDVDYVDCGGVFMPTFSSITVACQPVLSKMGQKGFNISSYSQGGAAGYL